MCGIKFPNLIFILLLLVTSDLQESDLYPIWLSFIYWFWNGCGLVLVSIILSFIRHLYAIYLYRYMVYKWLIIEC